VWKEPGGRKKQVQARGKTPRSQSLFFTAFALLAQLIGFFNSPQVPNYYIVRALGAVIKFFNSPFFHPEGEIFSSRWTECSRQGTIKIL